MLESFFTEERVHGGWRFWILWVLLTNVGFFAGLLVEWLVFPSITLWLAVPMAAFFQGAVLNRHIVIFIPWIIVTTLGWWVGVFSFLLALSFIQPELPLIARLPLIGALAGLIAGIPQWYILRGEVRHIGWALMLPGVITGIPLAYFIEYDYRDLVYRPWRRPEMKSEKAEAATDKVTQP